MKSKSIKQEEALERQRRYNLLTDQQKIDKLNLKLGVDIGAERERKKIWKRGKV